MFQSSNYGWKNDSNSLDCVTQKHAETMNLNMGSGFAKVCSKLMDKKTFLTCLLTRLLFNKVRVKHKDDIFYFTHYFSFHVSEV